MKIIALPIKVIDFLFQKSGNQKRVAFNVVLSACLAFSISSHSFSFIYIIYVFIYIHYICIVLCTYVRKKL